MKDKEYYLDKIDVCQELLKDFNKKGFISVSAFIILEVFIFLVDWRYE